MPSLAHFRAIISCIILTLVCALSSAVCRAQIVTVRVGGAGTWTIPDKNAADPRSQADRAVIDAFEREHPNIHLANANGLQISGPAAESNILLQFAGGTAPDVVYVNFRSMENFIQQGFLSPLDPYLAKHPEAMARVNPKIRKVITVDGHVYALPWAQFVQALYYRRDLFQEAGLDPDKPPTTWDEFYDDCKKITNPKTGVWGFEWPNDAGGQAYWWVNFLWQAGGEVTQQNARGQWVAAFNSPQGVQALDFYKKLVADPYTWPGDGKSYNGVANSSSSTYNTTDRTNGKVAMWFSYQSNVVANLSDANSINPSLIGIAAMPAGPGGRTANEINAAMWGMSSQIKDPKVRDAAWEFMQFMGSDEADRIRTKAYVDAGLGNLINPTSLIKYGYADEVTHMSKAWLAANKTLFAHGHPEPYGANMQQIYNLLGQPLQSIALHPNANPQALLANAAKQVNDKLIGYTPPRVLGRRRAI
ncbi:MAG TPA: sugar ABC transporter substrate-binding protein, partial [Capsulimonadaceae bacterium]|nr:sugar ABC transporter substrate-binding protein [Capsulimonadaceae bacterium]